MAFDTLFNQPESELHLLRKVAAVVKAEFDHGLLPFHYLKLKRSSDKTSEIVWVKSFENRGAYLDEIYSYKFEQARIVVYFCGDHFRITLGGFDFVTFASVFLDHIEYFRMAWPSEADIESRPAPPRNLVEAAFGDLRNQIQCSAKKQSSA